MASEQRLGGACHSERSEESLFGFHGCGEIEERFFAALRMTCELTSDAMYRKQKSEKDDALFLISNL